jgi:hypothetical protein
VDARAVASNQSRRFHRRATSTRYKPIKVIRYFSPDTCLIQGPGTMVRALKGWIDVEKAAEAQLLKKQ